MLPVQRIDVSSSTIFRLVLIVLGIWFLYVISDFLLMLFAAAILAAAVEPLADRLQKYRFPRAVSVGIVYIGVVGLLVALVTLMIPALVEQTQQLSQALPSIVERFEHWFALISPDQKENVVTTLQQSLVKFGEQFSGVGVNVFQQTRSFFSGTFTVLFMFVLAFYLVLERDVFKKLARSLVPAQHLPYVESRIDAMRTLISRWVIGQLTLGLIVGVAVGVGLWLIGIKYALILGIFAGVMEIIPVIGPIISAIPAILLGLTESWVYGLVVLVFYIVVQQIENGFLVPNIMRKTTGLNPVITLIAVLLGARLAGIAGAILAVPAATMIVMIWNDIFAAGVAEKIGTKSSLSESEAAHLDSPQ